MTFPAGGASSSPKSIKLRFLLNPVKFEAREDDPTKLGAVVCERTRLEGEPGHQKAVGTGEFETIPAKLALVSIGYKAVALPGTEEWFDDERGIMRNDHGRVDGATETLGGLYTSGWVKRGPTGIIGTNIADAKDTVTTILADLEANGGANKNCEDDSPLFNILWDRQVEMVDWVGYRRIEAEEKKSARSDEQPREKLLSIKEQLDYARGVFSDDEDSDETEDDETN